MDMDIHGGGHCFAYHDLGDRVAEGHRALASSREAIKVALAGTLSFLWLGSFAIVAGGLATCFPDAGLS